jgi:hypothetical protein
VPYADMNWVPVDNFLPVLNPPSCTRCGRVDLFCHQVARGGRVLGGKLVIVAVCFDCGGYGSLREMLQLLDGVGVA